VIVINRDKDYDPVISQKMSLKLLQKRPRVAGIQASKTTKPAKERVGSSSSDDEIKAKTGSNERNMVRRKNDMAGQSTKSSGGKYASDNEQIRIKKEASGRLSSATTSTTQPKFKKALIDSSLDDELKKPAPSRPLKVKEEYKFKWVRPPTVYPEKYGQTKIKIV